MKKGKQSNQSIYFVMFLIIVALTSLLFFGLGNENKTELQLISFGFIIFAELVNYLSVLLPSLIKSNKLSASDFGAAGVLYGLASFLINYVNIFMVETTRKLLVYNCAAILIYLLILAVASLIVGKNEE